MDGGAVSFLDAPRNIATRRDSVHLAMSRKRYARLNHRPKKALGFKKTPPPAPKFPRRRKSVSNCQRCPRALADDHGVVPRLAPAVEDTRTSGWSRSLETVSRRFGALRVNPDVIVMDISMPVMSGISATGNILERAPQSKSSCSRYTRRGDDRSRWPSAHAAMCSRSQRRRGRDRDPGRCGGKTIPCEGVAERIFPRSQYCLLGQGVRVADTRSVGS